MTDEPGGPASETPQKKKRVPGWLRLGGVLEDRWYWWTIPFAGIALPIVGAPLAFEMFSLLSRPVAKGQEPDIAQSIWATVGVVLTLAGVVITIWDQRRQRREARSRTQDVTRFTDELGSTLDVLVDYAQTDGQRGASDDLIKNVLREGRRLFAHDGVRLSVYMLETTEAETEEEATPYLVLREYDGRRDSPRAEFAEGVAADELIRIAKRNRAVAVPDPANPPEGLSEIDHNEHSGWKSYLAVPLIRGRQHLGVLLIDTRHPTNFTDADKSIGWTIARLLVNGLRATEKQALEVRHEGSSLLEALFGKYGDARPDAGPGAITGSSVEPDTMGGETGGSGPGSTDGDDDHGNSA